MGFTRCPMDRKGRIVARLFNRLTIHPAIPSISLLL